MRLADVAESPGILLFWTFLGCGLRVFSLLLSKDEARIAGMEGLGFREGLSLDFAVKVSAVQ